MYGIGTAIEQHWMGTKPDSFIVDGVNDFKWLLLLYYGQQMSKNNLGQRLEPRLKNNLLTLILVLARLFMVFFAGYYVGPDVYHVFNWSFVNLDFWSASEIEK